METLSMEEAYSIKEVIEKRFTELSKETSDRHIENLERLTEIKEKVTQTNGRVKSLELWRSFLLGAWAVLSIATPIVWYFIAKTIDNLGTNLNTTIDTKITQAINANNDKYFQK